ncbi:ESX secretion-associated protein EspG, partial [Nocardia brasiliensis]|uniref:ESX secretion-associated protein EspG n=1 Tax=Nocardia brasiliensis TaxID=37326 RepID=UPI0024579571
MTSQWSLSAEQFAAAWFGTGLDRLPFPFRFTSRFPGLHEYQLYQQRFRDELAKDERIPLSRTITALARPDWRIELLGCDNTRDGVELRAIGCATRSGVGVIAQQEQAPDGGRVQLRRCRAEGGGGRGGGGETRPPPGGRGADEVEVGAETKP